MHLKMSFTGTAAILPRGRWVKLQVITYNYYLVLYHQSTSWGIAVIWICDFINGHDIVNRLQIVMTMVCLLTSLYSGPISYSVSWFNGISYGFCMMTPPGYQWLCLLWHYGMETLSTLIITGPLWEESTGLWWIPLTKVPVIPSFGVCSRVSLNQRLNNQPS